MSTDGGNAQPGAPGGPEHGEWVLHVANQLANAELPRRSAPKKRRWVPVALAGALVVGAGAAIVMFGGDDDDPATPTVASTAVVTTLASLSTASESTTPSVGETTPVGSPPSSNPEGEAVSSSPAVPSTTVPAATVPASTVPVSTVPIVETTVDPATVITLPAGSADSPVRWAEYSQGVVSLRGRVPDQATADEIATKAAAVVGEANVRVEYTIDPSAPRPNSAPLYVYDSILFDPDQAELDATARSTLDLGVSLLSLYPQVTFDIEGHTDNIGTDAENQALAQRRVDVIVAYLTERDVDTSRLTAVAKGESEPIADNSTPEGRAKNRRIEISVNDLLG